MACECVTTNVNVCCVCLLSVHISHNRSARARDVAQKLHYYYFLSITHKPTNAGVCLRRVRALI